MEFHNKADRNLVASYFGKYGRRITETLEEVLQDLGASDFKIESDLFFFTCNGKTKSINLKSLMMNVFCDEEGVDHNINTPEVACSKTLTVIEKILSK